MQKKQYEQPKLLPISLALNDVLLASTGTAEDPDDPAGTLDTGFTVNLGKTTWKDVWN